MRYIRATTCWLEGTQDDLRDRRRAVLGIARGLIDSKTAADLELDNIWPMIPVDTISPRLANLICVAYKDAPERTFSKSADGTENDDMNKGFDDLYDLLNLNEVMDQAYRAALFTNTVLIYWSDEEKKFLVLTPEYFRISDDGIWIARRTGYTRAERMLYNQRDAVSEGEIVYDVWNDKTHEVRNHSGQLMISQCEENKWGMFPGVLMKLIPSNDLYGAGISEAAEINAATNLIGLFELRVALYYGFPIAVGTNMRNDSGGSGAKNNLNMGPGKMLMLQDPDGTAHPDFKFVSPDGKFSDLQEFKRKKISSFIRNQDLPGFLVDESMSPPSGVALQVLESPLNRVRQKHLPALRRTEKTLVKFVEKLGKTMNRPKLAAENFEINYADAQEFTDPSQELEFDLSKAENGLTTPKAFAKKYLNVQRGMTDATAIELMKKNKASLSFLTAPALKESVSA